MADSIPWEAFSSANHSASAPPSGFVKYGIPYKDKPNALQTCDIWIPNQDGSDSIPASAWPIKSDGLWIVYIHGGAWRDPAVASRSFNSPASSLLGKPDVMRKISGMASLNYTLSPHPSHATDPSPPSDPSKPRDPSRMGSHPVHILDVLTGIEFLQTKFGFGSHYLLTGHSCGAALTLQAVMNRSLWGPNSPPAERVLKPKYAVGLNGLYDMPALVYRPGKKHEDLAGLYQNFIQLAFGMNEDVWEQISPSSVNDWAADWSEGVYAALVQSKEDTLVPYSQTSEMMAKLDASKSPSLKLEEFEAGGDHNDLWQYGQRLADILGEVVLTKIS